MRTIFTCFALLVFTGLSAQTISNLPRLTEKNGHHALLVDGKPYFILGGQAHNSSAWPGMMPRVWTAAAALHLNTLEVPVYWEQMEPQQGRYDLSVVDTLILQARQHHVRLVLLWFATWKNGSNHYMPAWMKQDAARYPNITGAKGQPIDSPSPHSEAALQADMKAFAALMRHLKLFDKQHTVIMVQVENEPGSWNSTRDRSAAAQKIYESDVPATLLKPAILQALKRPVDAKGNWQQVFGDRADEYFQAWHIASYIGKVASAGKAEYPLPLYVNAALRDPLTDPPATHYESGGPTDNVIPIWKAAAPMIDLLAPDIYLDGSERILEVIDLYARPDNALFVPEAGLTPDKGRYLYSVLGNGGIGFSPFGIDDNGEEESGKMLKERLAPFAVDYEALLPMAGQLARWSFEGKIKSAIEREDHGKQTIDLGNWEAVINFGTGPRDVLDANQATDGRVMIVQLTANEFVVIGARCHVIFKPKDANAGKASQYLSVEEGRYDQDIFKPLRILNGDETDWGGPHLGVKTTVLRISMVAR